MGRVGNVATTEMPLKMTGWWRSEDHLEISPADTALPCTAKIAENLWHPNCRITSRILAS